MRKLSELIVNQRPVTLPGSATVSAACQAMRDQRVGSVLVTGIDGRLAGIFTGRDAVGRVLAAGRDGSAPLAEVMTPAPAVLAPGRKTIEALRLMADQGFRHVPIVDDGRILGVVSRGDFGGEDLDRLEYEQELWEHLR